MNITKSILSLGIVLSVVGTNAQDLPKPSPKGKVEQLVGLTEISITYNRPSAKDRKIFGELVKYDNVWRTGANERTVFTTSEDIMIEGEPLPVGKYGLLTIPGEGYFQFIFSKDIEGWGEGDYKPENNALVVKVKTQAISHVETLTFSVDEINGDDAKISLTWEKTKASFTIKADSETKAWKNIETAIEKDGENWRVYRSAASYCVQTGKRTDDGLKWIEKSINLNDTWYSHWVRAELLAAKKDYKGAVKAGETALSKGEADAKGKGNTFSYKDMLVNGMGEWKKMK
ncbi:MAG: DUF2911 domain-containing protein [Flavobacteriales bacterium]